MQKERKISWFLGSVAMLIIGIVIVPKFLKRITGEIYKKHHENFDFENFGPEVVKKDTEEEKENGNQC